MTDPNEEIIELSISDIKYHHFFNKKILVVGNEKFNEDTPSDKIIISSVLAQSYLKGTVIADKNKIQDFYLKASYTTEKINMSSCYRRYTFLLKNRIFKDNTYLILDNFVLSSDQLQEIKENIEEAKMMVICYYPTTNISKHINFDYLIITEFIDDILLTEVYDIIKNNYGFTYDCFCEIIQDFIEEGYAVVVKINKGKLKVLDIEKI